eukprot:scaffold473321_cov42-Prasinocladus_malaysianus.AAC.2
MATSVLCYYAFHDLKSRLGMLRPDCMPWGAPCLIFSQRTEIDVLYPKSINIGELYGEYNALTSEWTDGLASTLVRHAVTETGNNRRCVKGWDLNWSL